MQTLTVTPETPEKLEALLAFLTALKIEFKPKKEKPYNPEFVAKIKRGEEAKARGDYRTIAIEDLWK